MSPRHQPPLTAFKTKGLFSLRCGNRSSCREAVISKHGEAAARYATVYIFNNPSATTTQIQTAVQNQAT